MKCGYIARYHYCGVQTNVLTHKTFTLLKAKMNDITNCVPHGNFFNLSTQRGTTNRYKEMCAPGMDFPGLTSLSLNFTKLIGRQMS